MRGKYHRLFSSSPCSKKPGSTGPSEALIQAIVELKSPNPRFGCPRIARIISHTFGVDIDKHVVYRVLSKHHLPAPGGTGPSWLSLIGHTTDSLWSVDLFRCESIVLRSYWVLVVMDQFTRRFVGVGVHRDPANGADLCRMFNAATGSIPHFWRAYTGYSRRYLDLLFRQYVGLPPKVLAGIFRFQRFYRKWAEGQSFDQVQD